MDLSVAPEFYYGLRESITSCSLKDSSSPEKLTTPTVIGTPEPIRPTVFGIPESILGTPDIRYLKQELVYLRNESMNIVENSTIESDQNMVPEKKKHPGGRKKKYKSKKVVERRRIIFEDAEELSQFQKENKEYRRRYRREVKQGIRTPAKQQKRGRPRKLERTPDGKYLTEDAQKMKTKRCTEYMKKYRERTRTN